MISKADTTTLRTCLQLQSAIADRGCQDGDEVGLAVSECSPILLRATISWSLLEIVGVPSELKQARTIEKFVILDGADCKDEEQSRAQ